MIKSIDITNVRGIESMSLSPGSLTIISGANGVGKSSVLDAVAAVFEGGHDPTLIRAGAKKAEILLTLANGATIKKTITERSSTLVITDPQGVQVARPQSYVERLASGFGFDPLAFIAAKPKDRAAFLLEAMPITFTVAEVNRATQGLVGEQEADCDLDELAALRKLLYTERTACNVRERDADGTIAELRRAMPENDGVDWDAKAAEAEDARVQIESQITAAEGEAKRIALTEKAAIIEDINSRMAELAAERERRLARVAADEAGRLKHIGDLAKPERERIAGEIATARERAAQRHRAKAAEETIEFTTKKARECAHRSMKLTTAIEALDALKKQKLDALPLEGFEVRDGEVFVGGLPFDSLNTAQQYLCSFQIAALKQGELGLMICDRAETLDNENFDAFCAAARESGFQILTARVTDGPLQAQIAR